MDADVTQIVDLAVRVGASAAKVETLSSLVVRKSSTDLEGQSKTRAPFDVGNLRNSIGTDFGRDGNLIYGDTGPTADYGAYVEFGHRTRSGSVVAPQPYMMPAADVVAPNFIAAMEKVVEL